MYEERTHNGKPNGRIEHKHDGYTYWHPRCRIHSDKLILTKTDNEKFNEIARIIHRFDNNMTTREFAYFNIKNIINHEN